MAAARIMHVDDEPDIREVVRLSLEVDPGLTVRSCASGAEALAAVHEWPPDLVLLDDAMPHMDGPRTLAMLHQDRRTAAIPIVFMTARTESRDVDYFSSLGAAGVIAKPFEARALPLTIRRFLAPRRSGLPREEYLTKARRYATELATCRITLPAGSDRDDDIVLVRQLAHFLAEGATLHGCRAISLSAKALDDILAAEAPDADIRGAIDLLLANIFSTISNEFEACRRSDETSTNSTASGLR